MKAKKPLDDSVVARGGFPVLFLIATASVLLAFLLKNHAFGKDVDEGGTIYTRALLLSIIMVSWIIVKALMVVLR